MILPRQSAVDPFIIRSMILIISGRALAVAAINGSPLNAFDFLVQEIQVAPAAAAAAAATLADDDADVATATTAADTNQYSAMQS